MLKIKIVLIIFCFSQTLFAQQKPIIKSSKVQIDIRVGKQLKKDDWTLSPDTNPDVYRAKLPDGKTQKIAFITNLDSISFDVKVGQKYDFIIKKNDSICNTQILGVYDSIEKYQKYSALKLYRDFDMLKNAYTEAKVGLWYNSYSQFDSICKIQRSKIKDGMYPLDFYKIIAPITAFTKEGHSSLRISSATKTYFQTHAKYLPLIIKIIDNKIYAINDLQNFNTKGLEILAINGNLSETILKTFINIEPSDGFNVTSKYHWIESKFAKYYAYFFETNPNKFLVQFKNPKTNEIFFFDKIPSFETNKTVKEFDTFLDQFPNYDYKDQYTFTKDLKTKTATLTFNSFSFDSNEKLLEFNLFLDNSFKIITENKIQNLIIDIRKNEGGNQGVEDKVMSYLIENKYKKYKYVEIPGFEYSFLPMTNYKNEANILKKQLCEEFELKNDGRYLLKDGLMESLEPNKYSFKGSLYILTSGLSFSGGSEFAALVKNHTKAKFIGEEVGGGYYGNTSGQNLRFTLPNTKLTGRIPLHKYVVETIDNSVPFGHGLFPDYKIQPSIDEYLNGFDAELEFTKKLIEKNQF